MIPQDAVNALVCPRCGASNKCGFAQGQAACWCMQVPPLQTEQAAVTAAACFCQNCLTELTATGPAEQSGEAQQYKPESTT